MMLSPAAATATAATPKKKFRIVKRSAATPVSSLSTHAYISQLSPQKKQLLLIAQTHLDTSFHLEEAHGFLAWRRQEETK